MSRARQTELVTRFVLPLRLVAGTVLLLILAAAVVAVGWIRDDRAIDQRGSVTEGVVTAVHERFGRDRVVVRLDQLDNREISVTRVGSPQVGQRLAVEYDPDGPQVGRTAGTGRDGDDGRRVLLAAAVVVVLVGALTPWRRRPEEPTTTTTVS